MVFPRLKQLSLKYFFLMCFALAFWEVSRARVLSCTLALRASSYAGLQRLSADTGSEGCEVGARPSNPTSAALTGRNLVLESCSHVGRMVFWLTLVLPTLN